MATSEKVRLLAESYAELSENERHEFVSLVAPIDHGGVSEEWLGELRGRAKDVDSGRVELVEGEDFLSRLRGV